MISYAKAEALAEISTSTSCIFEARAETQGLEKSKNIVAYIHDGEGGPAHLRLRHR